MPKSLGGCHIPQWNSLGGPLCHVCRGCLNHVVVVVIFNLVCVSHWSSLCSIVHTCSENNVNSPKITHSLNMQYLTIVPWTVFLTTGQVRWRDWRLARFISVCQRSITSLPSNFSNFNVKLPPSLSAIALSWSSRGRCPWSHSWPQPFHSKQYPALYKLSVQHVLLLLNTLDFPKI